MSPGRKLRDWFVEGKLYFNRTAGYLNIFNFLMIALIFMNTTLWEYDAIQQIFGDRKFFLFLGFAGVVLLTALIGYLDTRWKVWQTESSKILDPARNPMLIPTTFQSAKMLSDLKRQGVNTKELEAHLDHVFEQCNLKKEFDFYKEKTSDL